jgi:putative salt-induced outer membrane protein YdiY
LKLATNLPFCFYARLFMRAIKKILIVAGILAAVSLPATAQTNIVTVTNVVTVLVTNVVTVTNIVAVAPAAKLSPAPVASPEPPAKFLWESSASAGLTLTRGNSETLLFTAGLETHRKTPFDEYNLGVNLAYGKNDSVKSADLLHTFGQWNHLFSERAFSYMRADGVRDEIADVNYRVSLSPGAGYYFVKATNTTLAGEVGPGVVFQELGNQETTFSTLRLAERFEHKFNHGGARVWESVEFLPQLDRLDNYLVNAEAGVESALSKKLSLQVVLDDSYDNRPAAGRLKNDVKIISGIKYKF